MVTTSPPDVQNVPDVWRLLEQAREYVLVDLGGGDLLDSLDTALAQRDHFVLVPKEPTQEMQQAGGDIEIPSSEDGYNIAIGSAFMDEVWDAMLAAAPRPEGKP